MAYGTRGRMNAFKKELERIAKEVRPKGNGYIIFSPMQVDHRTDPDQVQGMPFLAMSGIKKHHRDHVHDLATLIEQCRETKAKIVSFPMPFDPEYIQAFDESDWILIGNVDNADNGNDGHPGQ